MAHKTAQKNNHTKIFNHADKNFINSTILTEKIKVTTLCFSV